MGRWRGSREGPGWGRGRCAVSVVSVRSSTGLTSPNPSSLCPLSGPAASVAWVVKSRKTLSLLLGGRGSSWRPGRCLSLRSSSAIGWAAPAGRLGAQEQVQGVCRTVCRRIMRRVEEASVPCPSPWSRHKGTGRGQGDKGTEGRGGGRLSAALGTQKRRGRDGPTRSLGAAGGSRAVHGGSVLAPEPCCGVGPGCPGLYSVSSNPAD